MEYSEDRVLRIQKKELWALLTTMLFVAFGVGLLIHAWPLRPFSQENLIYDLIWLDAWGLSFVALIILVWNWVARLDHRIPLLLGILSFYGLVTVSMIFAGTHFPENGYWGDQKFRLAMLTKFATFGISGDFYYQNLPSFYPPLYYAFLSWWGRLTGVEPYTLFRTGYQLVWVFMPALLYLMWRRLVSSGRAFAIVLATFLIDAGFARLIINAPYVFVGCSLFFPWWLRYVEQVGPAIKSRWRHGVIGGLIGALLFSTYFYPFFILTLIMAVRTIVGNRWRLVVPGRQFRLLHAWEVLGGSALLSAPFWLPVMLSVFRWGGDRTRGEWFHLESTGLSFPFLGFDWAGLFFLAGIAYLIWRRRDPVIRSLLYFLIALLAFVLLGSILGAIDVPINLSKAKELSWFFAGPAVGLGLAALLRYGRTHRSLKVVMIVTSLLLCLIAVQGFNTFAKEGAVERARSTRTPGWGARTPARAEMNGKVVLTAVEEYFVFHPVYTFIAANENYSHPASRFIQRYDLLNLLQRIDDPYLFALTLRRNQFDAVDYFQPEISNDRFGLLVSINNYPNRLATQQLYYSPKLIGDTSLFHPLSASGIFRLGEVAGRTRRSVVSRATLSDSLQDADNILLLRTRLNDSGKQMIDTYGGQIPFPNRALLAWPDQHYFDNRICLIGAELFRARDSLHLFLTLRANRKTTRDLRLFIHLFPGKSGAPMQNLDLAPDPSTTRWLPGDIFTYERAFPDPGPSSTISCGFFDADGMLGKSFSGRLDIP
jgi:galactan 5-O-arabinofuranosyltransferase